jgi:two-component system response regulator LytT
MKGIKEIQLYSNSRLKAILPPCKDDEVIVSHKKAVDFKLKSGVFYFTIKNK